MTQARRPPESRARDRLGRLRPPPAPPLGPREPVIRLSTERARAGRPGNCRFPLTRGACGRPESGGQQRPAAGSLVITTGRPCGDGAAAVEAALRGRGGWGWDSGAGRRRAQGGAGGVRSRQGPGCGHKTLRTLRGRGLWGPLAPLSSFWALPPLLEEALGLQPDRHGAERPQL